MKNELISKHSSTYLNGLLQSNKLMAPQPALVRDRSRSVSNEKIANYGQYVSTGNTKAAKCNKLSQKIPKTYRSRRTMIYTTGDYPKMNISDCNTNYFERFTNRNSKMSNFDLTKPNNCGDKNDYSEMQKSSASISCNENTCDEVGTECLEKDRNEHRNDASSKQIDDWLNNTKHFSNENSKINNGRIKVLETIVNSKSKCNGKELIEKKLKKQFGNLESCCKELLNSTKSLYTKSYSDEHNFYNLLEGMYDSLKKINQDSNRPKVKCRSITCDDKKIIKEDESELMNTTCEDTINDKTNLNTSNNISQIVIKPRKKSNKLHESCNQNNLLLNNNSSSDREKSLIQINSEIEQSTPIITDMGKLQLGELLQLPKVDIRSKSVVGIHKEFVQEQYVIVTYRRITEKERKEMLEWNNVYNIPNNNGIKKQNKKNRKIIISVTTGKVTTSDNTGASKWLVDQGIQTVQNTSEIIKDELDSATKVTKNNQHDYDIDSLSWQTDNLSPFNEEEDIDGRKKGERESACIQLYDNPSKYVEWSTATENRLSDTTSCCEEVVKCLNDPNQDLKSWSSWSIHGCKVRSSLFYQVIQVSCPNVMQSVVCSMSNYCDNYPLPSPSTSTNSLTKSSTNVASLPPRGLKLPNTTKPPKSQHLSKLEINCQEIKDSLEQDVPLPENLSNLYDRLSKLQKMLECIPEEKIVSTLDALDHMDDSSVDSICQQGIGDVIDDNASYEQKTKGLLEFSTKPTNRQQPTSSKFGDPPKSTTKISTQLHQNNSDTLLFDNDYDNQSDDATNSLSLLENLIDDFLLKNGLSDMSKN